MANPVLSARQQKWFDAVREGLVRETGKTLDEWAAIARTCPETGHRARLAWLKREHGLGVNRGSTVLEAAFPEEAGWSAPDALLAQLWRTPAQRAIFDAVAARVGRAFPESIIAPRKTFVSFSHTVQFAAILPVKAGAELGLPLDPAAGARLQPMKKRPWAERHSAILPLASPAEVDGEVERLLGLAWTRAG